MDKGKVIKELRLQRHMTQEELAKYLGTTKQTIYKYENNIITNIPSDNIVKLAGLFGTSPLTIMGMEHPNEKSYCRIPVLGRVAAGIPLDAIEEIIDWEEIPQEMAKDGEYFGLKINGDSMSPRIQNGDVVIVRKQDDADTDDIVIALVNGNEGCCKKLKKTNTGIMLISFNPAYDPMVFDKSEIDCIPVRIIGKVVELLEKM